MTGHPNLNGWWKLDGNGNDSSGNGFNATSSTGVTYASGIYGSAGVYTVTSITILPVLGVSGTIGRTIAFKWKATSWAALNWCWLMGSGTNTQLGIYVSPGGVAAHFNVPSYTASKTMSLNTWYDIAVTFPTGGNLSSVLVYVNGELIAGSLTGTNAALNTSNINYYFGGHANSWPSGSMDDVKLFNIALPQSGIKRIMLGLNPLTKS